jgi:xylose isomerase
VGKAKKLQQATGVRLLWGTANMFSHPRYMHGAASNPDPHVVACCAMQVRRALDATLELGGANYVFWGGREGYETLLNTDMKRERAQMAAFFHMAVDYAKKIGFTGQFLIEPKPHEPTKHQYDFDSATVLSFLREFDLLDHFKLNVEANHATLAGHSFAHELAVAAEAGKLGSVDANVGDPLLGWDTDQFPTDINDTTRAMLVILENGGLGSGGLNFDAKVRRPSIDTVDLFHAHIGGMDTFARALLAAQAIIDDGRIAEFKAQRYAGWDSGLGKSILDGNETLESLEAKAMELGEPKRVSGRQEMLENILINAI